MQRPDPEHLTSTTDGHSINDRQQFADQLNRLRERAGLTVRDVARATGVPHSTVGGYLSGRHLPPASQPDLLPDILRACGVEDEKTVERWVQALTRVRRLPGPRPGAAVTPYRGLASFQPEDAEWFFGRHQLTQTLLDQLAGRQEEGGGPVALVGPSGSGKSSLLRAGVIPALRDGGLAGGASATWPVLLFTPGARPLGTLASRLADVTDTTADEIARELRADPARCAHIVGRVVGTGTGDPGGLAIVVDQFEEIFTECTDEDERQLFVAALHAAATTGPGAEGNGQVQAAAAVLLGLRADFYHRALRMPRLVMVLQQAQVAIGSMNRTELREAIVAPARKAGLDVEDGLVEVLLRDLAPPPDNGNDQAAHDAGALPLLSHALRATWERGTRWRLTVADYEAAGGVRGAVARTAEAVFDSLTTTEQEVARRLFVRLVRVGEDAPNTRRRVPRQELEALAGGDGREALGEVLDRFVDERLITVDAGTVEITHEAMVAAWPRLRGWIEADRRELLTLQQLDDDARRWRRDGRDPAMLYQGARLAAVQQWAGAGGPPELTGIGREFLQASVRRERRRVRVLYQTIAALAVLLLLAVTGGGYAVQQRGEALAQRAAAADERNLALSRMVALRADRLRGSEPALAGQLALAAYEIAPTEEARSSLLSASAVPAATRMRGPRATMLDIAFHPGRDLLVGASDDSASVLLWDVADRHRPVLLADGLPGLDGVVNSVALRPDGRLLAAGGGDHTVHLYDLDDPADPVDLGALVGARDTIHTLAFSPHGRVLAAGTHDGTVHLWDVSTPEAASRLGDPLTAPGDSVAAVAFSPNGRTLVAAGYDTTVHRWDVTDPAAPDPLGEPLTGPDREVLGVAFSPDATMLAAGSADEGVYLWDVDEPSPEPAEMLTGPSGGGAVHTVAFSPDGRTLAAGSDDGQARLWDLASGEISANLPHPGPVAGLVFEPGGQALYGTAADVVRRWTLPGPIIRSATGSVRDLQFHPGVPIVIGASSDGHLYLWDVADQQAPELLSEPLASPDEDNPLVGTVALSPDGRILAAGGHDGTIWRWDIAEPRQPAILDPPVTGLTTSTASLAFSPDGQILAAGGPDGAVQLWDLTSLRSPAALASLTEGSGDIRSIAFSPDGRTLAAGGGDRVVWLWDISDPRQPALLADPVTGPDKHIDAVAFSPDGDILAVGGADERVRLFDLTDPGRPRTGPVLTGPGSVQGVSFSADGRQLTAASRDHRIWQWDLTEPAAPAVHAVLTGPDGAVNAVAYHPDGHTLAASSSDTTVRLFSTDPADAAAQVCAVAGDRITEQEWAQHVPGLPYDPPC